MGRRGVVAVTGDAHSADQALLLRAHRSLERAALAGRSVELGQVADRVQLQQVDPVDLQALQRLVDLPPGVVRRALASLRRKENVGEATAQPGEGGAKADLGLAVAPGDVEVVDPRVERLLHRAVGDLLAHLGQGGRAVDQHGTDVAGPTESSGLHQVASSLRWSLLAGRCMRAGRSARTARIVRTSITVSPTVARPSPS